MSTRNIVPRADGEGQLGTASKNWLAAYIDTINTDSCVATACTITTGGFTTVNAVTVNISSKGVITGSIPSIEFDGTEGSGAHIALRENAGNLELYDVNNTTVRSKWSASTGRRITPLVNPTEHYLMTITAHADDETVLAAAHLIGGIISYAVTAAPRNAPTDTAANIIAALTGYAVGTWFDFTIINNGASTITVTAGADVTLSGLMTVLTTASATFKCIVTAATTVSIYRM